MEALLNPAKTHLLKSSFLYSSSSPYARASFSKRALPFTCNCKLKTSQGPKKSSDNVTKKIWLSGSAPELDKEKIQTNENTTKSGVPRFLTWLPRRLLSVLSNLPLAIGEMFTIAALMALGNSSIPPI